MAGHIKIYFLQFDTNRIAVENLNVQSSQISLGDKSYDALHRRTRWAVFSSLFHLFAVVDCNEFISKFLF